MFDNRLLKWAGLYGELEKAVTALGYDLSRYEIGTEAAGYRRLTVYLYRKNNVLAETMFTLGIYDFDKHTFVD